MRSLLAVVAASVVLGHAHPASAQVGQYPFALTREGQMLGAVEGEIASFKGLAYAAAPVGALRWQAPQAPDESSEMRTAYDYGPACLQPATPRASEDCLTLNVFRPFGVDGPLPVMVFVHGGSFTTGTASDPLFDGARLVQAGVIVVTLNYRLGALGWLVHPAFAQVGISSGINSGSDGPIGNFGLMDQIAALGWVHDNIVAFGGDPNNVTLFGAGTGALSVALLMLCEPSRGLFQKAILQSVPAREHLQSQQAAQALGQQLLEAMGRGGKETDPRAADARRLVAAEKLLLAKSPRGFGPTVDGHLVESDVADGFRAGRESQIPLIIGSNDDETSFIDEPALKEELALAGGPIDDLRKLYPDVARKPSGLAAQLYTDRVFTEPVRMLARAHAATGAPTFRYRFAYVSEAQRSSDDGGHGRELQFIFGVEGVPGAGVLTRRDREVADRLRTYWTNFAKTGDPNGPGLPHWDASANGDKLLLISNESTASVADPWSERLDRLERRSPKG
jgi:para-nitrobenzyl esterase